MGCHDHRTDSLCNLSSRDSSRVREIVRAWIVVLVLTGTAAAQDKPATTIEVGAGWMGFPDDGLVSEMLVGGASRWYLLQRVSVGPEIVYVSGESHSHLTVTGNLTVDLRSQVPGRRDRLVPFVVVGGGLFSTREAFPAGDFTSYEGAFTAGGGIRASASDRLSVGLDVRVGWETHLRINGFVGLQIGQ